MGDVSGMVGHGSIDTSLKSFVLTDSNLDFFLLVDGSFSFSKIHFGICGSGASLLEVGGSRDLSLEKLLEGVFGGFVRFVSNRFFNLMGSLVGCFLSGLLCFFGFSN